MQTTEARLRARYAETDQMGVVYHANYFVWMEVGRVELCRAAGIRYRDMEERDGVLLTVADASCRFLHPARYDDEVTVRTSVRRSTTRLIEFSYEILQTNVERLLARGATTHLWCGLDLRPRRLPENYWKLFGVRRQTA